MKNKPIKFEFQKNNPSMIVGIFISIFAIAYFIYQIYMFTYTPFETEVALVHDYTDKITIKGVVLKQEQILEDTANGIVKYTNRESSKIVSGSDIATVYSNENDLITSTKIKEKQALLDLLKSLESKKADIRANYHNITGNIKKEQTNFVNDLQKNDYSHIKNNELVFLEQMLRQEIIVNSEISYNEQIQKLESEIAQLSSQVTTVPTVVKAPLSGYFTEKVDGFEGNTIESATVDLSLDAVNRLINQEYNYQDDKIGKIITSTNWQFLGVFSSEYIDKLKEGNIVEIIFTQDPSYIINAKIEKINYNEGDKEGTILLSSSNMGDNIVNLRVENPSIVLKKSNGIKVSKSALRINNIEEKDENGNVTSVATPGVYISFGQLVKFKKVKIDFETEDYVICSVLDDPSYLQIYDEIILEGENLYDGKPIR